ncbi:MAG: decaprenyl-phosphate phosphoribosyltransferase [candidate division Zixibacteria bacterium]|nr:decaprenyl-phosphate phosphoribosyltransferase [candidate division Zixibacteria bacterium]
MRSCPPCDSPCRSGRFSRPPRVAYRRRHHSCTVVREESFLRAIVVLLRPEQWVKNLIIFGALIFAREFTQVDKILAALLTFGVFCVLSSAVYVINDIHDRESDRMHPLKKNRPIASGAVGVGSARALAIILILLGLLATIFLPRPVTYIACLFVAFNILYTALLKHIVIIDVMAIAASFVIRAAAGSYAIAVPTSPWLIACTFLLALFIGFGKRRHELVTLKDDAVSHRVTLKKYSPYFLDQLISVVTASTVVAYTFYTLSPEIQEKLGVEHLELTIPFVLYGIFRYLYLIHQEERGGSPASVLLSDIPILVNVVLWFLSVMAIFMFSAGNH